MFFEYIFILKYLIFCIIISFLLFSLSFFFLFQKPDIEKLSAYECGFNPFGDARIQFNIKFYIVGILFIIFDLEIIFLFPWVISLGIINTYGICVMFIFLIILSLGFIYEWSLGALNFK